MNVAYCEDYEELSVQATSLVISALQRKKNLLVCAASGASPSGLYERLAQRAEADRGLFDELTIIQLDEWGGLTGDDPGSGGFYLRRKVLDPLGVPPNRYISFVADAADPHDECRRVRSELDRSGPIDLAILGLGVNGHIGFNEPGPSLRPDCHVAKLTEETRRHHMVRSMQRAPRFGLTLGMEEILAARKAILLVAGQGKSEAISRLLAREVSTALPASFLWLHKDAECLIDRHALASTDL